METKQVSKPWWKYPMVWFILSGPMIVVVAGIATVIIAVRGSDRIVDPNYYANGIRMSQQPDRSMMPAMDARNHAVTPTEDLK